MSRLKLKFGARVEEPLPPRPGMGKALSECTTLHEVAEFHRLAERASNEGRIDDMHATCPHCHRKFSVNLIDGMIMVPDGPGDPVSKPARVVDCPNHTFCGRQFRLDPPKGSHFEVWPS
jgi:hypothetical protein